jgi:SAM-dependent methyltransferase
MKQTTSWLQTVTNSLGLRKLEHQKISNFNLVKPRILQIEEWLKSFPEKDRMIYISDERFFQHEEEKYDDQYPVNPASLDLGKGVLNLLSDKNCDFQGAAIEIGCGTGVVSRGLLTEPHFQLTIISDPSPKFVNITKAKLKDIPNLDSKARFAILRAEDLGKLPPNTFSAIILRSVLHHVIDVEKFLSDASLVLAEGGILIFEEPCTEGFILMGSLAQFIPVVIEKAGESLTESQRKQINLFVDAMKFYANRTIDKSSCEDKHLFRVDELMKTLERVGLTLDFYPNLVFSHFRSMEFLSSANVAAMKNSFSFSNFFYNYLKYCMQFNEEILALISEHFIQYCTFLDEISSTGNAPYSNGVFVCQKKTRC